MRVLAVIALGGAMGSCLRYLIAQAIGPDGAAPLTATLIVNVVGSLAIGAAYPWVRGALRSPLWQPFIITGLLGGFTTFSTLAADVVARDDQPALTLGYLAVTLVAGLIAVPVGGALHGVASRTP